MTVYEAGAMPFVQLYRDFSNKKTNTVLIGTLGQEVGNARQQSVLIWKKEQYTKILKHSNVLIFSCKENKKQSLCLYRRTDK